MNCVTKHPMPLLVSFLLASTALCETTSVPVEIQSVDARGRKITVRYGGKVKTLDLSDDAAIILEGKATDLNLVTPGDTGSVEFDKTISAVTRLDVRRTEMAPAERLGEGWEEIDQRLLFLMVRLVDVEANLDAIDKAMGKSRARAGIASAQASRAQAGNDRMDRRAGGPVRWDQFYGTTAEKFFYHPTDNHRYHTRTILGQQSPGNDNQTEPGVPSRQGLPVHQRPPQFDYMYRANENARKRAEGDVAKFRGNAAVLAARRHQLELEQSKLWCEVAFRAVSRNDLDRKALYRFAPQGDDNGDLLAATKFVVTALSIVENGQKDQATTFRQIKPLISKARYELGNKWLQLRVNDRDGATDEGKFAALAQRLEDVSANLGDSYTVSVERENAGDSDRRDLYRGLLQQALIQYAETVMALDEMASEMAKASEFAADLNKPLTKAEFRSVSVTNAGPTSNTNSSIRNSSGGREESLAAPLDGESSNKAIASGPASYLYGDWIVSWVELGRGNSGTASYSFSNDYQLRKAGRPIGRWSPEAGGVIRLVFDDRERGQVILRLTQNKELRGRHTWRNGQESTWIARKER